jgi:hypothetical protein
MNEVHHPLSPSNYNAWQHCPSWSGQKYDTVDASAGTEAHEQLDRAFKEEGYEPDSYVARWAVNAVRELAGDSKVSTEVRLTGTIPPVVGVYGTADAIWWKDGALHIADLKTFSDGTKDYTPQLMGYACLFATRNTPHYTRIVLHILHGGICKVESREFLLFKCKSVVRKILERKRGYDNKRNLCDYCSTCSKVKECKETMNALEAVKENSVTGFGSLSLCQKLVVLDAVDKLSATIREEAKREANANGGVLEMDGIRYEMKPWAGKPKVKDLCQLAGAIQKPVFNRINKKDGSVEEVGFDGLDNEQLLELCDLPKSKLVDALKKANADNKSIKKVEIERWVSAQYESTDGTPHFVRTK